MFRLVLIACVFRLISGAAVLLADPDGRIVGGESTTIEEFPHQVSMRYSGSHICGGSIITDRAILTAAHCVHDQLSQDIQIAVGSTSKTKGVQIYEVKKIIKHEDYNSQTIENDIAILILSESLKFGDTVQPIELPIHGEDVADGSKSFVSGWGLLSEEEFDGPDDLQFVEVEVINQKKCTAAYEKVGYKISDKMLCAGIERGGRDTCQQDSGGPLISNSKLIGVVSFGLGCGRTNYPGVYTKVSAYRNWIDQKVTKEL